MRQIIRNSSLFTLLSIVALTSVSAQETETPAATVKPKNYLEVSYGPGAVINFQAFSTSNNDQDQFDFDHFSNSGTFGIRYDRFLNPSVSLGLDFFYLQRKSTGIMTEYATGTKNQAEYIVNRFRTQIRIAYHFPISNPDLDIYLGGGLGINNQATKLLINGAATSRNEYPASVYFPVSMRTFFGFRYSFTKHFGANAELGIGGPLISAGFHFRF